jgi:hypothetical protein
MKTIFKVIIGVIIAAFILGIGGCALGLYATNEAVKTVDKVVKDEQKKTDNKDTLLQEMLDKAPKPVVKKDEFNYTVTYTLKNDTKEDFDYIQLNYDVFDKDNVKLSNDFVNITDVKAGQTFKLKLDLYQEGADHYKITSITSDALK